MNEREVQTLLIRRALVSKQHVAAIGNSRSLLFGESDLISVTKAGLVHEFEVKCSRADYLAEFRNKKAKHLLLDHGGGSYVPNYYWFVTHGFEIEPPEYAGWLQVLDSDDYHYLRLVKDAPRLHRGKWDSKKVARIARLLSFRLLGEYEEKNGTGR